MQEFFRPRGILRASREAGRDAGSPPRLAAPRPNREGHRLLFQQKLYEEHS
jgi:hypothetical protein